MPWRDIWQIVSKAEPMLELLAPVTLNIVCFRVRHGAGDLDQLNGELVKDLHESGSCRAIHHHD